MEDFAALAMTVFATQARHVNPLVTAKPAGLWQGAKGRKTSGLAWQGHVQLQRTGPADLGTQTGPQAIHRLQDQTIHHFSADLIRFGRLTIDTDQGRTALRTNAGHAHQLEAAGQVGRSHHLDPGGGRGAQ
jgi:hypothetical protein